METLRTCALCARDEAAIERDGCWCLGEAAQPVRFIDSEERRQELEGAYKLGRADALAELAQSDEWRAMVLWMEAFMRINVTTAITDATWESLRDRVDGT